ncbi:MAG: hypothetical protein M0007_09870 [Actinomycetota bacterium]|jgi:hypothetical protein|nr:hypothetical protein [Actinomycetota bacterium]
MGDERSGSGGSGLRLLDGLLVVGAGVVAVLVAFALLHFIVGMIWAVVKIVAVVGVIAAVAWVLVRRRS